MKVFVESFDGRSWVIEAPCAIQDIRKKHFDYYGDAHIYFTQNCKKLSDSAVIENGVIRICPKLLGGKGGFGSMLRAIGAQIEKTTNREACRDLSGRRLRDINEEKRLKNWIAQQAEREKEAADRRKKKLERLCFEPKHDFSDKSYEKARTELTEKVHDAVEQGFRSAGSSTNLIKRKSDVEASTVPKKKKTCLWVDDIEDVDISSEDSDSDSELGKVTTKSEKEKNCTEKPEVSSKIQEGVMNDDVKVMLKVASNDENSFLRDGNEGRKELSNSGASDPGDEKVLCNSLDIKSSD